MSDSFFHLNRSPLLPIPEEPGLLTQVIQVLGATRFHFAFSISMARLSLFTRRYDMSTGVP